MTLATAEADIRLGEHRSASQHFEEALALSRELRDTEAQVRALIPLALASASDGRTDRALQALEEARRLGGEESDRFTECEMLKMEALTHFFANDYERCRAASSWASRAATSWCDAVTFSLWAPKPPIWSKSSRCVSGRRRL